MLQFKEGLQSHQHIKTFKKQLELILFTFFSNTIVKINQQFKIKFIKIGIYNYYCIN